MNASNNGAAVRGGRGGGGSGSQWGARRSDGAAFEEYKPQPAPAPSRQHEEKENPATSKRIVGATLAPAKKAEADVLTFVSPLLNARFGGPRNVTRARALLRNDAVSHAMDMMRSESARVDARLLTDFDQVLAGQCVYLPTFFCDAKDTALYSSLKEELLAHVRDQKAKAAANAEALEAVAEHHAGNSSSSSSDGEDDSAPSLQSKGGDNDGDDELSSLRKAWSKHEIFENPDGISPTFNTIIAALAEYFDVEVYATRLNYYRNGSAWKTFHHDSHAYGGRALREDFTMGVSLGATRALAFLHEDSGRQFEFPQLNGDVFCFTNEINTRFMHGVPKASRNVGERFSIIAWGRRREINARNGGRQFSGTAGSGQQEPTAVEVGGGVVKSVRCVDDAISAAQDLVSMRSTMGAREASGGSDASGTGSAAAAAAAKAKAAKKKNRLQ